MPSGDLRVSSLGTIAVRTIGQKPPPRRTHAKLVVHLRALLLTFEYDRLLVHGDFPSIEALRFE